MSILSQHVKPTLSFGQAVSACLSKYATFTGRARRSEYWWFYLFSFVIGLLFQIPSYAVLFLGNVDLVEALLVAYIMGSIYCVALFLPSMAVLFRRLHDTGHSGWYCLLGIIPLIGAIILLVWCCQDSDPMPNKYGPSPKYED